jgi:hypothetical protein
MRGKPSCTADGSPFANAACGEHAPVFTPTRPAALEKAPGICNPRNLKDPSAAAP